MKTLLILACMLSLSTGGDSSTDIPEPYCSITELPFDGHGWFGHSNAKHIQWAIQNYPIKTVIEIGSWLGTSTRFIAEQMPEGGKVYAVDTWLGTQDDWVHMVDPRLSLLYHLFLSNVKHANLTDKIIPIRMKSLEAVRALNVKADLIYIDGAHDEESVFQDIVQWSSHLNPGGIMCGDDWQWDSVRRGILRAVAHLHRTIFVEDNFWKFE